MAETAAKAGEMMEVAAHEAQTVNRFGTPDLNDKGIWMTRRIREKYGHLQDRFIVGWLGGLTAKNENYFVHTKNAVALAEKVTEGLNPIPSVKVWFVLAKDPKNSEHIEDAADLYQAIAKWASDMGALRVIDLDKFTDVPKPLIQRRLGGRLLIEETMYIKTEK